MTGISWCCAAIPEAVPLWHHLRRAFLSNLSRLELRSRIWSGLQRGLQKAEKRYLLRLQHVFCQPEAMSR